MRQAPDCWLCHPDKPAALQVDHDDDGDDDHEDDDDDHDDEYHYHYVFLLLYVLLDFPPRYCLKASCSSDFHVY